MYIILKDKTTSMPKVKVGSYYRTRVSVFDRMLCTDQLILNLFISIQVSIAAIQWATFRMDIKEIFLMLRLQFCIRVKDTILVHKGP